MRLLLDEIYPPALAERLADGGHAAAGTPHCGIVFVPRNSFPRDRANIEATLGALVTALDALLDDDPDTSRGT